MDDVEAVVQDLEARDVQVLGYSEGPLATARHIAQIGPPRAAWFHDPDGTTLGPRRS